VIFKTIIFKMIQNPKSNGKVGALDGDKKNLSIIDRLIPSRKYLIYIFDAILVVLALYLAFQLRFDFNVPPTDWNQFLGSIPIILFVRMAIFTKIRLHSMLWRYFSLPDFLLLLKSVTIGSLIFTPILFGFFGYGLSRGVLLLDWGLCLITLSASRLAMRTLRESFLEFSHLKTEKRKIIVVGAGDAGEQLVREIRRGALHGYNYDPIGFVDDEYGKKGRKIQGCEVLGVTADIASICRSKKVDELLIALPGIGREDRRKIIRNCRDSGLPFKIVPSLMDLYEGRSRISQIHEVEPVDILGREEVELDLDKLREEIQGKAILITGAGGSVGSELCRQIAKFEPRLIVMYERAESSLYFLELEMKKNYPSVKVEARVGDILNSKLLDETIRQHSPEIIFHAAAYKHVPLMEAYPLEAIRNNIFGSENVGKSAINGGVKKVVFISTDKAVSPVGVMGMTKRVSECLLQTFNKNDTSFVAVRFGNVLGSDGSVLPIFKGQIERGETIKVTDLEATRFFMLISEAAKLVIQAGLTGRGGEIFFLDMGRPVRILDMAKNLVRLGGYELYKEVNIEVSGLRPGERIREDLLMEKESLLATDHEKVFAVESRPLDLECFASDLENLRRMLIQRDKENSLVILKKMATHY
jgi:FlaA1/EpsC-like NDP-sugar epimerase